MFLRNSLFILLVTLCGALNTVAQTYPVTWGNFKDAEVVSGTLQHTPNSSNRGLATSNEVLFGQGNGNVFDGYLEYAADNTVDLKRIGFVDLDEPGVKSNTITYGFSFEKNSKVRAISPQNNSSRIVYSAGAVFRIERVGSQIEFSIDGTVIHSVSGDNTENFHARAELRSANSVFSNVMLSFNTTFFCVVPEIDHVDKKIRLAISGAYPPYTYEWQSGVIMTDGNRTDPSNAPAFDCFVDGNYFVEITDANGDVVRKMFSVGEEAIWGDFFQSEQVGTTLQKTIINNRWGSAKHTTSFAPDTYAWAEYIIEKDPSNGKKAFGFVDASKNIRRTRDLKAGFAISNNNVQVISNGSVVLTEDYEEKDALHIQYKNGNAYWLKNGIEIYDAEYAVNGDVAIAGLAFKTGVLKDLHLSIDPNQYVDSKWLDASNDGIIDIDVTDLSGVSGPFHYIISPEQVPSLTSTYSFLKDTLNIDVDSTDFFEGKSASLTHQFAGLEAGTYYVTVFDNEGHRIIGEKVQLQPALEFLSQTNFRLVDDKTIRGRQNGAIAELDLYTYEGEDANIMFTLNKANGTNEQFLGLIDESATATAFSDLAFGFYLVGNRLYTVENGVQSSTFIVIRRNKELSISIEGGQLKLFANGNELAAATLPAEYTYKVAVGTQRGFRIGIDFDGGFKKPKYKFKSGIGSHLNCEETQVGAFTFTVNPFGQLNGATTSYSITNTTTGEAVISNGIANDAQSITVDALASGDPLTAGIYQISLTINATSPISFVREVCLGYEVEWDEDQLVNYEVIPTSNSVTRQLPFDGTFSTAISRNVNTDSEGWIEFTPQTESIPYSSHYLRFRYVSFLNEFPSFSEGYLMFKKLGNQTIVIADFGQSPYVMTINGTSRLKVRYDANEVQLLRNGNVLATYLNPFGGAVIGVKAQSKTPGDAFLNIVTSFGCGLRQTLDDVSFAELKKQLDGGFTVAVENTLKFTFDSEYAITTGSTVAYSIYDDNREEKASSDNQGVTSGGATALAYSIEDNRYELDLSGIQGMEEGEFYTLEIKDSKGDKKYLKFLFKY